jgi:hypothetical protein
MKGKPQNKSCPVCGHPLDIDTYVPGQPEPVEIEPGDITFCFECRTIFVFNLALNIVLPDEQTLHKIAHDPDFYRFVDQIDTARKNKINLN